MANERTFGRAPGLDGPQKRFQALGPLHGYASRRIEPDQRRPAGRQLRHAVPRAPQAWSRKATSPPNGAPPTNNRKASIYNAHVRRAQAAGEEAREWEQTTEILGPLPRTRKGIRMRSLRALLLRMGGLFRKAQHDRFFLRDGKPSPDAHRREFACGNESESAAPGLINLAASS